jgi:F-type H+-transporting ATPase subunit b
MDLHHIIIAAAEVAQEAAQHTETATETSAGGPLGTLGVNWKLFLAQLVNFAVVLFVFWKWVVKPLGKTLTDRQNKIESGLKNATHMEEEKQKFDEWKVMEMQKVRGEAEKMLKMATETADKVKQEMVTNAQEQSTKMIEQAKAAIEQEKTQMLKEVRTNVADLVILASEKILRSKLDTKKDHELVRDSVKEIG